MAGGTIRSSYYGDYSVIIVWSSTPDVETNTSMLTMQTYITYDAINISSRTSRTNIGGVEASYTTGAIKRDDGSPLLVNTRSMAVPHNDDGTGSVYIWSQFAFKLNSSSAGYVGEIRAGGWCTLDDIPRASKIAESTASVTVNGENAYSLSVEKAVENFRHKAVVTFGENRWESGVFDTETSFAVPVSWLSAMPTQMRSTADVSVQTYSDETCETAIGSPVTATFELVVPESPPVILDGWAAVSPSNDGAAANLTGYVQGYSRALVTFDGSKLSAQYGASISAVVAVIDGVNYNTAPYISAVLAKAGEHSIRCIATDSRGQQSERVLIIRVESYAPPTLTGVSLIRCDANGAANDAGVYLYAAATVNYSLVGGENFVYLSVQYGPTGSSTVTTQTLESGVGKVIGSGLIRIDRSYTATITATDGLGRTATYTAVISTAYATFNAKPGGRGFAFGKYAEKNDLLDSAWSIHSDEDIAAEGAGSFGGDVTAGGKVSGASGSFSSTDAGDLTAKGLVLPGAEFVASEATLQLKSGDALLAEFSPDGVAFNAATFGGAVFNGQAVFNAGADGLGLNFSETPELTGGTWFDGKPIWRVSKYYPNVAFGGVGQWTAVGVLPIDVHSSEINLIDFDMRLMHGSIINNGPLCVGYRLPIMGNNGYIATPWLGDGTNVAFNWVNASSVRPFDRCNVLVIIHYTRNE